MTGNSSNTTNTGVAPSDVSVEVETLTTFRDRVNGLLASLDASPAAPGTISQQQLTAAHLGANFQEVDLLVTRYGVVHQQLQNLSQALTDQINAMDITLQVSQVGYQNVEAEQISKLWVIQGQTTAAQPPAAQANWTVDQQLAAANAKPGTGPATPATATSDTSTTSDTPGSRNG